MGSGLSWCAPLRAACVALALVSGACGGAGDSFDEAAAHEQQAIGGVFRPFVPISTTNVPTSDPAVCNANNNQGAWLAVARAGTSTGVFRYSVGERQHPPTPWSALGSTSFSMKPTCAALDELYERPQGQWNYQKAIVGRHASNGRYYAYVLKIPPSTGVDPDGRPLPTVPTTVQGWHSIAADTYASAPAATVAGRTLIVCGRRSDARIYCHANRLDINNVSAPYDAADWTAAVAAPPIPSVWLAQGDPAVTNTFKWDLSVMIATRAVRAFTGQQAIFYTRWDGFGFAPWTQLSTSGVSLAAESPALETDPTTGVTLVLRGTDNRLYEGTALPGASFGLTAINASGGTNQGFSGSPAAAGGLDGWEGRHVIIARKNGAYYQSSPCPNPQAC